MHRQRTIDRAQLSRALTGVHHHDGRDRSDLDLRGPCEHSWRRGRASSEWCGHCFLRRELKDGQLVELHELDARLP